MRVLEPLEEIEKIDIVDLTNYTICPNINNKRLNVETIKIWICIAVERSKK